MERKKILTIAALLVLLQTAPSYASDWVYIDQNTKNTVYYYDSDTIQRSGNIVTVWEKYDYRRNTTVKYRERKQRSRFNCEERTVVILDSVTSYPDGRIEAFNVPPDQQEGITIPPDTVAEDILKAVCAATAP